MTQTAKPASVTKPLAKREVVDNLSDRTFIIASLTMIIMIIPFLYYANMIYAWNQANKPEGYRLIMYKDLWMTGVGAVSFSMLSSFLGLISRPIFKCLIPNNGDENAFEKNI